MATILEKKIVNCFTRRNNNNKHKEWMKSINKKYTIIMSKRLRVTSAEYMELYTKHKFSKWEYKHPKPWKLENTSEEFLFEEEYIKPWEELREKELERIRSFVASIYDKHSSVLILYGRFKNGDKYEEKRICNIRDSLNEIKTVQNLNYLLPTSNLMLQVSKITNDLKQKNDNFICCNLLDTKNNVGSIILPKAA